MRKKIEKSERSENGRRVDDTFLLPQKWNEKEEKKGEHLERETLLLVSLESLFIMHTPRCGKMKRTLQLKDFFLREHKENFQLTQFIRPLIILIFSQEFKSSVNDK